MENIYNYLFYNLNKLAFIVEVTDSDFIIRDVNNLFRKTFNGDINNILDKEYKKTEKDYLNNNIFKYIDSVSEKIYHEGNEELFINSDDGNVIYRVIKNHIKDYFYMICFEDFSEMGKIQKELNFRLYFETIISEVSSFFVNISYKDINEKIDEALKKIGKFCDADRSYVFLYSKDGNFQSNTHEWCAPGINPEISNLKNIPVELTPWWTEKIKKRENIYIPFTDKMPKEASVEKEILEKQNIISLIVVPIIIEDSVIGFLGLDSVRRHMEWSRESINILRFSGQIIANAINRYEKDKIIISERKFALTVMETMGQGLTITDEKGLFTYVNREFCRLTGYEKELLIGRSPRDITDPSFMEILDENYNKRKKGVESQYESRIIRSDGNFVDILINAVPKFENGEIKGSISVITDLTAQKAIERNLIESAKKAEESAKLKSEFIASVSHEIRTPMNGIIGFIELLNETDTNSLQKEYIKNAKNSAIHLLSLLNDIIDYSAIENNKLIINKVGFNFEIILKNLVETYKNLADKKSLEFIYEINIKNKFYYGDPVRIRQIIDNLVSNAIKFTQKGYVKIKVDEFSENNFVISVEDTGIGIEEDKKEKLFNVFTQADSSIKRKYGGTGLGLSITKKIVEKLNNGKIYFQSFKGKGTKFVVEFSLETYSLKEIKINNRKVLAVDDSETSLYLIKEIFRDLKYEVDLLKDPGEILENINTSEYDAVFLDINIGNLNGTEIMKKIKSGDDYQKYPIPIIAITGESDSSKIKSFTENGFDFCIVKPFSKDDIKTLFSENIEKNTVKAYNGLNLRNLEEIFKNDPKALRKIIDKIKQETYTCYMQINETKDTEKINPLIHKIKGILSNLYSTDINAELNKACKSSDINEKKKILDKIYSEIKDI